MRAVLGITVLLMLAFEHGRIVLHYIKKVFLGPF